MRPIKECYQHKNKFQINGICANTLIGSTTFDEQQQQIGDVQKESENIASLYLPIDTGIYMIIPLPSQIAERNHK